MNKLIALLVVVAAAAAFPAFTTPGQNVLCALDFAMGLRSFRLLSANLITRYIGPRPTLGELQPKTPWVARPAALS